MARDTYSSRINARLSPATCCHLVTLMSIRSVARISSVTDVPSTNVIRPSVDEPKANVRNERLWQAIISTSRPGPSQTATLKVRSDGQRRWNSL